MRLKVFFTAVVFLLVPLTGIAHADNKATVQTFYDFLSNPTSQEHSDALKLVMTGAALVITPAKSNPALHFLVRWADLESSFQISTGQSKR